MRCFLGVGLPERVARALAECAAEGCRVAESAGLRANPVVAANMHITVRFLGEIGEGVVGRLCGQALTGAVAGLTMGPIGISGVGAFPSLLRPRTVWAGVSEGSESLVRIRVAVDSLLDVLGVAPSGEGYRPHASLFRVPEGGPLASRVLAQWLAGAGAADFGSAGPWGLSLFKSVLTPRGPIYTALATTRVWGA